MLKGLRTCIVKKMVFFFCLLAFQISPLLSEENSVANQEIIESVQEEESKNYNYFEEFLNMIFTLVFVLVLILGTIWFLKKMTRTRLQNLNRSTGIKILERRALNQKSSLYLVDILGKGVVISESPAGIQVITEFPPGTDIELLLEQEYAEFQPKPTLFTNVQNSLKKWMKPHASR